MKKLWSRIMGDSLGLYDLPQDIIISSCKYMQLIK